MADWNRIPSEIVQVIVAGDGDPATVAWAHRGEGTLSDLREPMLGIAAAVALGNAAALQSVTNPKDLRKAAAAALHRLRSSGVKVEAPKQAVHFQLTRDTSAPPSRAFVSSPGPEGEVEFLLTASNEDESCALGLILSAGVEEVRHAHLSRSELKDTWRQAASNGLLEIPFTTGLFFADKYLTPKADGNWTHFLSHVAPGTLQSARILDPFAAPVATVPEDPENIGKSWVLPKGLWDPTLLPKAMSEHFRMGAEDFTLMYDRVVNSICEVLDQRDQSGWVAWFDLITDAFRLRGMPLSAEKAQAYKQALLNREPVATIPAVVNSVKLGLMYEAMAHMNGQEEAVEEEDHSGHDHSHGGHSHGNHRH